MKTTSAAEISNSSDHATATRSDRDVVVAGTYFGRLTEETSIDQAGGSRHPLAGLSLFCRMHDLEIAAPASAQLSKSSSAEFDRLLIDNATLAFGLTAINPVFAPVSDLWFANSRRLRFRLDTVSDLAIDESKYRIYQCDLRTRSVVLLTEAHIDHDEMAFFDALLANPYLPLLISVSTTDEQLIETRVLPFPSLCRGGPHYAELCAILTAPTITDDLTTFSRSLVDRLLALRKRAIAPLISEFRLAARSQDDAEAIWPANFRDWVTWLNPSQRFSLRLLGSSDTPSQSVAEEVHANGCQLDLPDRSLPTLNALLAHETDPKLAHRPTLVDFIVAEAETGRPLWSVGIPPLDADFISLQPFESEQIFPILKGPSPSAHAITAPPEMAFAIKYIDTKPLGQKVTMLMPVSPDIPTPLLRSAGGKDARVSVLIPFCGRPEQGLKSLVESLSMQTVSRNIDVIAIASEDDPFEKHFAEELLKRHFANRSAVRITDIADRVARLELAAGTATGDYLLVVDGCVVLHDARTVETLLAIASYPGVASAGCMLVRAGLTRKEQDIVFHSAGYFPLADSEDELDETTYPLECQELFSLATYPVVSNAACLHLSRAIRPADNSAISSDAVTELHVCTTAISASIRVKSVTPPNRVAIDRATIRAPGFPHATGLKRLRG